jgi:hypothetical protein
MMSKSNPPAVPKNANDNAAYDVGYGKPPTHTKFAKGKSGNPSGRPKGSKNNLALAVQDVFGQTVSVGVNGKNKKVALLHAMVTKVAAMAMTGDTASIKIALNLCSTFCLANDNSDIASGSSFELTAEQTEAISKSGLLKDLK